MPLFFCGRSDRMGGPGQGHCGSSLFSHTPLPFYYLPCPCCTPCHRAPPATAACCHLPQVSLTPDDLPCSCQCHAVLLPLPALPHLVHVYYLSHSPLPAIYCVCLGCFAFIYHGRRRWRKEGLEGRREETRHASQSRAEKEPNRQPSPPFCQTFSLHASINMPAALLLLCVCVCVNYWLRGPDRFIFINSLIFPFSLSLMPYLYIWTWMVRQWMGEDNSFSPIHLHPCSWSSSIKIYVSLYYIILDRQSIIHFWHFFPHTLAFQKSPEVDILDWKFQIGIPEIPNSGKFRVVSWKLVWIRRWWEWSGWSGWSGWRWWDKELPFALTHCKLTKTISSSFIPSHPSPSSSSSYLYYFENGKTFEGGSLSGSVSVWDTSIPSQSLPLSFCPASNKRHLVFDWRQALTFWCVMTCASFSLQHASSGECCIHLSQLPSLTIFISGVPFLPACLGGGEWWWCTAAKALYTLHTTPTTPLLLLLLLHHGYSIVGMA